MNAWKFGGALLAGCTFAVGLWAGQAKPAGPDPALMHPATLTSKAPDVYRVKFTTTKGSFVVEVTRAWAPLGADRFYNLVSHHFYDQASFFRVVKSPRPFVVQFGIHADPKVSAQWANANIKDDPVQHSNTRGTVTYAMGGPGSRTTQIFINLGDNAFLDKQPQPFAPFGQVVEGMDVVDQLNGEYGDTPTGHQGDIQSGGKAYLDKTFPKLDSVLKAEIVTPAGATDDKAKAPAKKPGS